MEDLLANVDTSLEVSSQAHSIAMILPCRTTLLLFFVGVVVVVTTPAHSFLSHHNNGDGAATLPSSCHPQKNTLRIAIPSSSSCKQHRTSNAPILHQSHSIKVRQKTARYARPKSKWDNLIDEDDDDDQSNISKTIPSDMLYTDVNIRRQMHNFDRLVQVGGRDAMNDVYVRAPGEGEWWLVGKIARVSGEFSFCPCENVV